MGDVDLSARFGRIRRAPRAFPVNASTIPPLTETQCAVISLTAYGEHRAGAGDGACRCASARTLRITICSMVVLHEGRLTIPLEPDGDHPARCRIELSDTAGWDVRLEIDDRIVARTHCEDWHHVERLCSTLTNIWSECHTDPSARR
jgi:hypothetical protein